MYKTQFFRFMRESNPRLPGPEPGAPQLELMDPEKIAVCVFLSRCRYGGPSASTGFTVDPAMPGQEIADQSADCCGHLFQSTKDLLLRSRIVCISLLYVLFIQAARAGGPGFRCPVALPFLPPASIKYHPRKDLSWKKSCELSRKTGKLADLVYIMPNRP